MHVCRSPTELIFAAELATTAAQFPALRLRLYFSQTQGRFDIRSLQDEVPDLAERATWLCDPAGLTAAVQAHWQQAGLRAPLHHQQFAAAPLATQPLDAPVRVECVKSARSFGSLGATSLLVQAEGAGLAPKHGCRIGICRSYQCIKRSGTVQNRLTGELSNAPDELIRLCVSAARSDLDLEL